MNLISINFHIFNEGVEVCVAGQIKTVVRAQLICTVMDLPAKASMYFKL